HVVELVSLLLKGIREPRSDIYGVKLNCAFWLGSVIAVSFKARDGQHQFVVARNECKWNARWVLRVAGRTGFPLVFITNYTWAEIECQVSVERLRGKSRLMNQSHERFAGSSGLCKFRAQLFRKGSE